MDELPAALRLEHRFSYDIDRYPFPRLVAEVLRESPAAGPPALDRLHDLPEVQTWLTGVSRNNSRPYAMRRNTIDCRLKAARPFLAEDSDLRDCYERFVCEVVEPMVAECSSAAEVPAAAYGPDRAGLLHSPTLYQRDPNVRVHLPGTGHHLTQRHCDADYHHQPLELNFWIPLTSCSDSNTLWVESAPGKGDFHPFELKPGEGMRFWGHSCEHYTLPNETDHTRVSFDFRVVPCNLYRETYPNSHRRDGLPRFATNGFFSEVKRGCE